MGCGRKDRRSKGWKGEIDFVGVFKGQLIIASCKTESKIKSQFFNDLSTMGDQLGKGMCSKIFVTSTQPEDEQREGAERWAKDRNITVVYGDDLLSGLEGILEKAAMDRSRL